MLAAMLNFGGMLGINVIVYSYAIPATADPVGLLN
jgi:hypothetical protein